MDCRKILGLTLSAVLAVSALAGCGEKNADGNDTSGKSGSNSNGVSLTLLNTKSEIQEQFETMAKQYAAEAGLAKFEVLVTGEGESPYSYIQKKYAAGDAPTLAMLDPTDIVTLGKEKALPLDEEDWASIGGKAMGISVDDTLYSLPFCVEGRGLIYNKTAIEGTTGKNFDPANIKTADDLKALFDELVAGGMDSPMTLAKEDWSLGAHFLCLAYEQQDFTEAGAIAFTEELKNGTTDVINNSRFNSLFDTLDLLLDYNINKADPLAADYNLCASYVAEGDVAFWFNGNWAWAEISDYIEEGTKMGIMPVVQFTGASDQANNQITAAGSKQIMIDKNASEKEIEAAKDFLNWLVYDDAGKSFIVNDCALVPAFSNNDLEITNQLSAAIKGYVEAGDIFEAFNEAPGNHWSKLGAAMQKYLANGDRAELADAIEKYWREEA